MRLRSNGSCEYQIDPARRLAVVQIKGDVTGADIADCVRRLRTDARWTDDTDVLWDEREIRRLDVTPEDLAEMVDEQTSGQTGQDIVLTGREEHEMVMRLYTWRVRANGRPAHVCTTLQCALDLLNLDELPPELAG
jgi:hypothetical protein